MVKIIGDFKISQNSKSEQFDMSWAWLENRKSLVFLFTTSFCYRVCITSTSVCLSVCHKIFLEYTSKTTKAFHQSFTGMISAKSSCAYRWDSSSMIFSQSYDSLIFVFFYSLPGLLLLSDNAIWLILYRIYW
jgi:hypothetical protein